VALVGQTEAQRAKARRKPQAPGAGDAPEEILAEVFGARPCDVEEIIQRRLVQRRWSESRMGLGKMGIDRRPQLTYVARPGDHAAYRLPKPLSRVVPRGGHFHPEPATSGVTGKPIHQPHSTCSRQ
jgi:hypothetical protein